LQAVYREVTEDSCASLPANFTTAI